MQVGLRPKLVVLNSREITQNIVNRNGFDKTLTRNPWGTAALGWICQIDNVATLEEVVCPTLTAVGGIEKILKKGMSL